MQFRNLPHHVHLNFRGINFLQAGNLIQSKHLTCTLPELVGLVQYIQFINGLTYVCNNTSIMNLYPCQVCPNIPWIFAGHFSYMSLNKGMHLSCVLNFHLFLISDALLELSDAHWHLDAPLICITHNVGICLSFNFHVKI